MSPDRRSSAPSIAHRHDPSVGPALGQYGHRQPMAVIFIGTREWSYWRKRKTAITLPGRFAMNAEAVATEELIAGKYRLTRLIGRGGMGSVWEGIHASLGTRVAVKFIDTEYINSEEIRSRFANEARAAAKLVSKHVVQVFDHGVCADGRSYIVMEFLAGEPLDTRLDRLGRLSPADTLRIVGQVCRGLAKAHAAGIVHRDLKPENIFLVWDEEDDADIAKVVDFGIAKFTDAGIAASSATRTGSVLGTPFYMSPEQARGLRTVDRRTDLWALGVVTYRCLVGALPFEGEALGDLLVKICTAPLPVPSQLLPGLPQTFDAWFFRALERDADKRFGSAAEFAEALGLALGFVPSRQISTGYEVSADFGRAPPPGAPRSPTGAGPSRSGVYPGGSTPGTPSQEVTQAAPVLAHGAASYPLDAQTADVSSFVPGVPRSRRAGPVVAAVLATLVLLVAAAAGYRLLAGNPASAADETAEATSAAAPPAPESTPAQPSVVPAQKPVVVNPAPPPASDAVTPEALPPEPAAPPARPRSTRRTPNAGTRTVATQPRQPRPDPPEVAPPPAASRTPAPPRKVDLGY